MAAKEQQTVRDFENNPCVLSQQVKIASKNPVDITSRPGSRPGQKRSRTEREAVPKQQKQEGLSWWTCLMLDIPQENRQGMRIPVYQNEEQPLR